MNTAAMTPTCPRCGSPIPSEAPSGLCPKCVLLGAAVPSEGGGSSRPAVPPDVERVRAAFPQLEIIELVGQGGMGLVYAARQIRLDRRVALKLLPMATNSDPTFVERFHREGRLLARLHHPHIVTIYDFGQTGGFCFLLMEFVDGVNLRQAMRSGRFSPREALAIVPQICEALQYAHEQGVLHRDIKPENILLDSRGRVKIADFGIAKLVGEPAMDFTLTASGARLGTPHYMAPEQIESPSAVDHRADIYSLGVVFYELLTGELPLGRFAPPSAKTELDARVDEIVLRALAKERELRQQSAGEVKTQVEEVATDSGNGGSGKGPVPPSQSLIQDSVPGRLAAEYKPLVQIGLVALLVLLVADTIPFVRDVLRILQIPGILWIQPSPMALPSVLVAALAFGLLGGAAWMVWLAWRHREPLIAPLGLAPDDPDDRFLRWTATGVILALAIRLGLLLAGLLGGVIGVVGMPHPGAGVDSGSGVSVMFPVMGALGILAAVAWVRRPEIVVPRTAPPRLLIRAGWVFLAVGVLAFLPTVLFWGSSIRVMHPSSLFCVVGIAALSQSRLWRRLALAICWLLLVFSGLGVSMLYVMAAGIARQPEVEFSTLGSTPAAIVTALILGMAHGLAGLAGITLLNRRDVKAAFGIALAPPPIALANPWPHRLLWLGIGLMVLPGVAVLASWLFPILHRTGGPQVAVRIGLLPVLAGILLFGLFWWTRPTTATAQPPSQWNPWPKRIFWTLILVVALPASLLLLSLVLWNIDSR